MDKFFHQQKELLKERQALTQYIYTLKNKILQIDLALSDLEKKIQVQGLAVSNHAIDRFKERVMDIPTKIIRQQLSSTELLEAYKKQGDGRYELPALPHVMAVIKDFVVVTIINKAEPHERLKILSVYMDYYIDELVDQELSGEMAPIMKLKTYSRLFYKAKEGDKITIHKH